MLAVRHPAAFALLFCGLCLAATAQEKPWERGGSEKSSSAIPSEDRIDINHASVPQLMKVPGMTKVWAERIVRFRPYHAKNDLLERGVLPSQVYDRIKDAIIAHRENKNSASKKSGTKSNSAPRENFHAPSQPRAAW